MRGVLDWRVPLVILLLLVIASATRWQTEATFRHADSPTVIYWKRDRWTNTRWIVYYSAGYDRGFYREAPLGAPPGAGFTREERLVAITYAVWLLFVTISVLWLLVALIVTAWRGKGTST